MKKVLSLLVAAALVTVASSAMAGSTTIVGTLHDLSSIRASGYSATNTTQICVFCHTPHNAAVNRALWNRKAGNVTSFALYTSGANVEGATWYAKTATVTLPANSPSMLCLNCHDGSTGMSNISRPPNKVTPDNGMALTSVGPNLGNTLTNDHPVSVNYDNVQTLLTATSLKASEMVNSQRVVKTANALDLPLANNVTLECNTCHNVHNNY